MFKHFIYSVLDKLLIVMRCRVCLLDKGVNYELLLLDCMNGVHKSLSVSYEP